MLDFASFALRYTSTSEAASNNLIIMKHIWLILVFNLKVSIFTDTKSHIIYDIMLLNCPRKIRDKERSDVNEFFEWRLEKVSNCWLRSVGSNYDTRLDFLKYINLQI